MASISNKQVKSASVVKKQTRTHFDDAVNGLATGLSARLAAAVSRSGTSAHRRYLVGIAGPPGSGKSLLAEQLLSSLRALGTSAQLITLDGFHYTRAELDRFPDAAQAHLRRGSPFTFDLPAFRCAVQCVRDSCQERYALPSFDHALKDPVPNDIVVLPEHELILVEGNYLALCDDQDEERGDAEECVARWSDLSLLFDELWFLDGPADFFVRRVTRRHEEVWHWSHERAQAQADANDALNIRRVLDAVSPRVTLRLSVEELHFDEKL